MFEIPPVYPFLIRWRMAWVGGGAQGEGRVLALCPYLYPLTFHLVPFTLRLSP